MKRISDFGKNFFIVTFAVAACSSSAPETVPPFPSATSTAIPPTATATQTSTPQPTLKPTWIPLPTLDEQEALTLVHDEILDNSDCRLPCWGGITPGVTSWEEATQFFATFATNDIQRPAGTRTIIMGGRVHTETIYHALFAVDEEGNTRGAAIGVTEGEISTLHMSSLEHSDRLQQFLADYGRPTQVYLRTFASSPSNNHAFVLALFYPDQHILVGYDYDAARNDGIIRSCPERVGARILLWAEGVEIGYAEIESKVLGADPNKPLRLLEDVTDFTIDSFYQTFKEPGNTNCIETPVEHWE